MTGIVDWALSRTRMIVAMIALALAAGVIAYTGLPKEGAPDIEVPALFVSVGYPGVSAEDSERLLVRPLESRLSEVDGLDEIQATAAQGYAGILLHFEFGWDKSKTLADVRDKVSQAQAEFPTEAKTPVITEFSFSEFPILVVVISGQLPERTLRRLAQDLQERIEALPPVLEAGIVGEREEMVEVLIDPLGLEAYNLTAGELISAVVGNNQVIAAGEITAQSGAFSLTIPSSITEPADAADLVIKKDGDRVVRVGDLADIRLTFQDRDGTATFNGESTIAMQVVKRKGFNIIETSELVRATVEEIQQNWAPEIRSAADISFALDMSKNVKSMVDRLEGSVFTAIALVMIVMLAALGVRSSLLVGFAIPTSFLLCFALLAILDIPISNIVMFGLILSVGMLVDSAIVIVELGDRRIQEGDGPLTAYGHAAKRMFWPIVSSTATTLCAFLPMLFWPGIPGQFMGKLPFTLIFVLSASLVVALLFLPVLGGLSGRVTRRLEAASASLERLPFLVRLVLTALTIGGIYVGARMALVPPPGLPPGMSDGVMAFAPGGLVVVLSLVGFSICSSSLRFGRKRRAIHPGRRRTTFGRFIRFIVGNPVMPVVTVVCVIGFVVASFTYYSENNLGVEFFVETEPENAKIYVRARGNLGLSDADRLVSEVGTIIEETPGVETTFAFAGSSGLADGAENQPLDSVGEIQIELSSWDDRQLLGGPVSDGRNIIADIEEKLKFTPGIVTELQTLSEGPSQGKPLQLRLSGENWQDLLDAVGIVRAKLDATEGLIFIDDTRPLPGIDWEYKVDVDRAGQFGADLSTVGAMVQLVTRGVLLDTMRLPTSDDEIEIRVRLREEDRLLSTLDKMRVQTSVGLVPLSNFVTREPVKELASISRVDQKRYLDVRADVREGLVNDSGKPINANERIEHIGTWLEEEADLPASVSWEWSGDQEEQEESQLFLMQAFIGALGLMFAILLAQFNSFYDSVVVLIVVVFATVGALLGMIVMQLPFSIIMTGTGIVALAGIVVNNNIVLIDTYQEYARYSNRIEAIIRCAEVRIRPVFLTTVTTMAGLTPMMLGISFDFVQGGYTINAPTALWWKQLATAVVFGLGIATVLTLVFTPSVLALRVWAIKGAYSSSRLAAMLVLGRRSRLARDRSLNKALRKAPATTVIWDEPEDALEPVDTEEDRPVAEPIDLAEWAREKPRAEAQGEQARDSRLSLSAAE